MDGTSIKVTIIRVKCDNDKCGVTHALLPSFIIPYKTVNIFTIIDIIKQIHLYNKSTYDTFLKYLFLSYDYFYKLNKLFSIKFKEMMLMLFKSSALETTQFDNIQNVFSYNFNVAFMQSHFSKYFYYL